MKSFMGVFIMLFMSVTSIGILSGFLSVLSAQDLHSCIISELEDSDFYEEIIKESFNKAQQAGDDLTLTLYYADNTTQEITSENISEISNYDIEMAKVNLKFNIKMGVFAINDEHILSGYAR
ncbi:MAG: hypothetical protein II243_02080 [Lachnospiraceae bacterium]|nr:hypothetical protein [Lachnospiraceae bacterium]